MAFRQKSKIAHFWFSYLNHRTWNFFRGVFTLILSQYISISNSRRHDTTTFQELNLSTKNFAVNYFAKYSTLYPCLYLLACMRIFAVCVILSRLSWSTMKAVHLTSCRKQRVWSHLLSAHGVPTDKCESSRTALLRRRLGCTWVN